MNNQPDSQPDPKWQALLARSVTTFTGDDAPPFGFVTSTLARLKSERGERELLERIGMRALFSALCILVAVGGFSLGLQFQSHVDLEPGTRSFIQAENVPIA